VYLPVAWQRPARLSKPRNTRAFVAFLLQAERRRAIDRVGALAAIYASSAEAFVAQLNRTT
jgi:hypothetical protein